MDAADLPTVALAAAGRLAPARRPHGIEVVALLAIVIQIVAHGLDDDVTTGILRRFSGIVWIFIFSIVHLGALALAACRPSMHYFVGGNSKVYGTALFRLREEDFRGVRHPDGTSPARPAGYDEFEPYYQAAEELFEVHGTRGEDSTEPWSAKSCAWFAISHEPRIRKLCDSLRGPELHSFHLPIGGRMLEDGEGGTLPHSPLLRCDPFDGYPSLTDRLLTDASGATVTGVETVVGGARQVLRSDLVVVACGTLSSALLPSWPTRCTWPTGQRRAGASARGGARADARANQFRCPTASGSVSSSQSPGPSSRKKSISRRVNAFSGWVSGHTA